MNNEQDKKPLFGLRVCATSANIGPGYDIAAIALDMFNDCLVFKGKDNEHSINFRGPYAGDLKKDQNSNNLVIKAMRSIIEKFSDRIKPGRQQKNENDAGAEGQKNSLEVPETLDIEMTVNIPPGKGLGSSASAVISGLLIANKAYNMGLNKRELFQAAAGMESSPDNAAAALSGGMAVVYRSGKEYLFEKISLPDDYRILLMIPPERAYTKEARKLLPEKVLMKDAVRNISNFSLLIKYLEEGDPGGAVPFIEDHLYQKYRGGLYPGSLKLVRELIEVHGIPAYISGAGPVVTAIMDAGIFARFKEIKGRIMADHLSFQSMVTGICDRGSHYL